LDACQVDDRCQGGGWGADEICGVIGAGGTASCKWITGAGVARSD
jgi:hypothetical protein